MLLWFRVFGDVVFLFDRAVYLSKGSRVRVHWVEGVELGVIWLKPICVLSW